MRRWSRRGGQTYATFMEGVTETESMEGRKYTMTHSDETGDLFVSIGLEFDEEKIGPIRDEVLLSWEKLGNTWVLYGEVLVDGEGIEGSSAIRDSIFRREMPTALRAIRKADSAFFEKDPERDKAPLFIKFKSDNPQYDKLRYFDTMSQYK